MVTVFVVVKSCNLIEVPMFQRKILTESLEGWILGDRGSRFLRNVPFCILNYTVAHNSRKITNALRGVV